MPERVSGMASGPISSRSGDDEGKGSGNGDHDEGRSVSAAPTDRASDGGVPQSEVIRDRKEKAFLDCMEAVEDLLAARQALAISMRAGFFNVARARYGMGPTRVGHLQYNSRDLCATALVDIVVGRASQEVAENVDGVAAPQFKLRTGDANRTLSDQPSLDSQTGKPDGQGQMQELGLRQRRGKGAVLRSEIPAEAGSEEEDPLEVRMRERSGGPPSSPLSWFGSLVSPHLRSAQVDFSEALTYVVRVANASARVERARVQFLELDRQAVGAACCGNYHSENTAETVPSAEQQNNPNVLGNSRFASWAGANESQAVAETGGHRKESEHLGKVDDDETKESNNEDYHLSTSSSSIVDELAQKYGL